MHRRYWGILGIALVALPARAEVLNESTTFLGSANGLTIALTSPSVSSNERIDCVATESYCAPLNASACGEVTPRTIGVKLTATSTVPQFSKLYIWLQKDTTDCLLDFQNSTSTNYAHKQVIDLDLATSPLVSGNYFQFPADSETGTFTIADVMSNDTLLANDDACLADNPVDETWLRLCFGVDLPTGTADNIESTEPRAWLRLIVDTDPPAQPAEPTLDELDGRLGVHVTSTATDVFRWAIFAVAQEDGVSAPNPSCDGWKNANALVEATSGASLDGTVSLTNGITYDVWVCAVDALGNASLPSTVVQGMPSDQCDFIECYPGDLKGGYCSASHRPAGLAWLLVLGLLGVRVQRRRR